MNGDRFEILKYPFSTGSFDHITGLELSENLFLEPVFSSTNLVLEAVDTRTAPTFDDSAIQPNGDVIFTLDNVAGRDFVIVATTNLEMPVVWTPILTNLNSGAVFEFVDADQSTFPHRFFRVALLQ